MLEMRCVPPVCSNSRFTGSLKERAVIEGGREGGREGRRDGWMDGWMDGWSEARGMIQTCSRQTWDSTIKSGCLIGS